MSVIWKNLAAHCLSVTALLALAMTAPLALPGVSGVQASEDSRFHAAASILPLHSLLANLIPEQEILPPLLPPGASPHSYAIRPSDAHRLRQADLVFWVGPSLETPLARALESLDKEARVVRLGEEVTQAGADPHLWLDPLTATRLAALMADALVEANPANALLYREREAELVRRLEVLHEALEAHFATIRTNPFATAHAAYTGLETRYRLTSLGALMTSPEQPPGAGWLSHMRTSIRDARARCLFADPQYSMRTVRAVADDTGARVMLLDPLGSDLTPGPDAYFTLMETLGERMVSCLSEAQK